MTTAPIFKSATREELNLKIEELLLKTGMTWEQLKDEAEAFTLNDANLATYKTVKSLRWVVLGK
ncbi:MAG: hypothetical protein RIQ39_846 [Actinomycetota bacterium]|jgi:hypothetical protein